MSERAGVDCPVYDGCPVCGHMGKALWTEAVDREYITSGSAYKYWQCEACASLYIDPIPEHELALIYPKNYYSFNASASGLIDSVKLFLDKVLIHGVTSRLHGDHLSVLDIGGGSGWLLDVVKATDRRFDHSLEIDLDEDAAQVARSHGHVYWRGKFEEYPAANDRKYDLILALNIIEHVKSPEIFMRKARSLLSEQGRMIIKTPNVSSLDARVFRNSYWGGLHCPRHWVLFNRTSLLQLVGRCDMALESIRFTQGAPFWCWSVLSLLADARIVKFDALKPMYTHWLSKPLIVVFAAFDFLRMHFSPTSQMICILRSSSQLTAGVAKDERSDTG